MAKNRLANLGERNSQTTKTTEFVDNMYSVKGETKNIQERIDFESDQPNNKPKNNKSKSENNDSDGYKNFLFPLKKNYHYYLKHVIAPQEGKPMYEILEKALEMVYPDIKKFTP